jgi:hypothetical protein
MNIMESGANFRSVAFLDGSPEQYKRRAGAGRPGRPAIAFRGVNIASDFPSAIAARQAAGDATKDSR